MNQATSLYTKLDYIVDMLKAMNCYDLKMIDCFVGLINRKVMIEPVKVYISEGRTMLQWVDTAGLQELELDGLYHRMFMDVDRNLPESAERGNIGYETTVFKYKDKYYNVGDIKMYDGEGWQSIGLLPMISDMQRHADTWSTTDW